MTSSLYDAINRAQAAFASLTPAEQVEAFRRQRHAWATAEAAWGSDADEAAYRNALAAGDDATLARLDAEGEERRRFALDHLATIDPPRQDS